MRALFACALAAIGCGGAVITPKESADSGAPGTPPAACPAPSQVTVVAAPSMGPDYAADGLVAWGGNVYFGTYSDALPDGGAPEGRIFRVPAAGGSPEPFATGFFGMQLATDGVDLFFVHGVARSGSTTSYVFPGLRAAALAGGAARDLERPVRTDAAQGLKPGGPRGVIYDAYAPIGAPASAPQHSVVRWDGRAMTVLVVTSGVVAWDADETDLYWSEQVGPGPFELHRQPLDGAPTTIATSPMPWRFFGHDTTTLYVGLGYDRLMSMPRVLRVPKAGGTPTEIASGLYTSFARPVVADGYIYFSGYPRSGTIERLRTTGGAPELFAEDPMGSSYVEAMSADECALYWIAANPARVLRKAR